MAKNNPKWHPTVDNVLITTRNNKYTEGVMTANCTTWTFLQMMEKMLSLSDRHPSAEHLGTKGNVNPVGMLSVTSQPSVLESSRVYSFDFYEVFTHLLMTISHRDASSSVEATFSTPNFDST